MDFRAVPRQKPLRILNGGSVVFLADIADAGRATAFDLIEQTGSGAAIEGRVGAVAEQEHLLQLVQGPVHRAGTGEGAKIAALFFLRAAMFLDLWELMLCRNQDIREAFVVPQQHIVARLELLDQVLLQKQRLGLRPRGEEHH